MGGTGANIKMTARPGEAARTHEVVKVVQILAIPKVKAALQAPNGLTKVVHCLQTMIWPVQAPGAVLQEQAYWLRMIGCANKAVDPLATTCCVLAGNDGACGSAIQAAACQSVAGTMACRYL